MFIYRLENISTTQATIDINLVDENHHQHEVGSKWSPLFEDGPGPVNVTARIGSTVQLDCKIQLLYDKTVCKSHLIRLATVYFDAIEPFRSLISDYCSNFIAIL